MVYLDSYQEKNAGIGLIYNLSKLRAQLKTTKDLEAGVETLFGLEALQKLVEDHLTRLNTKEPLDSSEQVPPTIPTNLEFYKEQITQKINLRQELSSYRKFMIEEIQKNEQIRIWRKVLHTQIPKLFTVNLFLKRNTKKENFL